MIKTYKFKLYNTKKLRYLNKQINLAASAWNHCIALHKRYYSLFGKFIHKYQLQNHIVKMKKLPKYKKWKQIPSQALQDVIFRIDKAYKAFFRKVKQGEKASPPRFKPYFKYKSITLSQVGWKKFEGNIIRLGKKLFKYWKSRDFEGKIKTITIKRNRLGEFFIYIAVKIKDEIKERVMTGKSAGIDFGLKTFLTFNNGTKINSPLFYNSNSAKLVKAQKKLSKKKKGSNNRKKEIDNVYRIHEKITNCRKDHHFKLAKQLVEKFDYIFLETLNIDAMKRQWGKKVSDLAFYSFVEILKHQASKVGCIVHQIDKWFPSSKKCSDCGYTNKSLTLKDRKYVCPNCGVIHDRDVNAAKNIYREGASSLGLDGVRLGLNQATVV